MSQRESDKAAAESRRDLVAAHPARQGHTDALRRFLGAALYRHTKAGNESTAASTAAEATDPVESPEVVPPARDDERTQHG